MDDAATLVVAVEMEMQQKVGPVETDDSNMRWSG